MYGLSERQDKMDVVILSDKGIFNGNLDKDDNLTITGEIPSIEEILDVRDMTYVHDVSDIPGYIGGCPTNCASHS